MKKHKGKIIAGVMILMVLAFAFWYGGSGPDRREWQSEEGNFSVISQMEEGTEETRDVSTGQEGSVEEEEKADRQIILSESKEMFEEAEEGRLPAEGESNTEELTEGDLQQTEVVPEEKVDSKEAEEDESAEKSLTCTLSIRCDTILQNISRLEKEKVSIVPQNGVIFPEKSVIFYEGESVFHVLVREMKRHKIHLEFVNTPIYNSTYMEGIANLYEFDCGELSGWMYKVNGWFPNYGCSRYQLKDGDVVEWVYTCDLGKDVGGDYSAGNGRQYE